MRIDSSRAAALTASAVSVALLATGTAHAVVDNRLSLVSVASPEVFPDANGSFTRAISDDGRFVVFASGQPNLVVGDEADPGGRYVYLRDLQAGTTTRLSHGPDGYLMSNAAISADGGYVAFASNEGNGQSRLRLYNRATGITTTISREPFAPNHWYTVTISDDARYVYYTRTETVGGVTETRMYRYAVQTGVTDQPVAGRLGGTVQTPSNATVPSTSADGRYLTFVQALTPAAAESEYRLIRLDTSTGDKIVVGRSGPVGIPQNAFGDPSMSNDGRYIAYVKVDAQSRVSTYVYDAVGGTSQLISHRAGRPASKADNGAGEPQISGDGRYVAFTSAATNIVPGVPAVTTIFIYDRRSGSAEAIVRNRQGVYPASTGGYSSMPCIDGDGSTVAFTSRAQNLSAGADTRLERVFAWQRP